MKFVSIRAARHVVHLLLGCALGMLTPAGAWAQARMVSIPPSAVYGELQSFDFPSATIDNRTLHLAPGARIFNQQNLIILPASAPQQASVMYRLDINGDVREIWLLSAEEAADARQRKADSK